MQHSVPSVTQHEHEPVPKIATKGFTARPPITRCDKMWANACLWSVSGEKKESAVMNSHGILRVAHHDPKWDLEGNVLCSVPAGVADVIWVDAGEEGDRPQLDA